MSIFKAQLRIPTEEQYAYIEVSVEDTPENIVSAYREFTNLIKPKPGLPKEKWNKVLDGYLRHGGMTSDDGAELGKAQEWMIHELDKSMARIGAKELPEGAPNNHKKP